MMDFYVIDACMHTHTCIAFIPITSIKNELTNNATIITTIIDTDDGEGKKEEGRRCGDTDSNMAPPHNC